MVVYELIVFALIMEDLWTGVLRLERVLEMCGAEQATMG